VVRSIVRTGGTGATSPPQQEPHDSRAPQNVRAHMRLESLGKLRLVRKADHDGAQLVRPPETPASE
jgi:hypothetical protein